MFLQTDSARKFLKPTQVEHKFMRFMLPGMFLCINTSFYLQPDLLTTERDGGGIGHVTLTANIEIIILI